MTEAAKQEMIEGVVAFSNVTKHDVYQGKDTGNFTLTITMGPKEASILEGAGVVIKDYEGKSQRKFKSQFPVDIIDTEDAPITGRELPYGTKVRVLYAYGPAHPEHGVPVYMNKIRVLEMGGAETPEEF